MADTSTANADAAGSKAELGSWTALPATANNTAQPLGDLTVQGDLEKVHRRGWRWRRGLFLRPGYYRRGWHGHRYRYSHGPFRYRYHGWYYNRPWWIVDGYHPRYPRRAYYYDRYRVYSGGRCDRWANRCARNWGTRNPNFYGCMRYHRCR